MKNVKKCTWAKRAADLNVDWENTREAVSYTHLDVYKRQVLGSVTYIGTQTKKIEQCFQKYGVDVAIKRCKTVFDKIKNNNI